MTGVFQWSLYSVWKRWLSVCTAKQRTKAQHAILSECKKGIVLKSELAPAIPAQYTCSNTGAGLEPEISTTCNKPPPRTVGDPLRMFSIYKLPSVTPSSCSSSTTSLSDTCVTQLYIADIFRCQKIEGWYKWGYNYSAFYIAGADSRRFISLKNNVRTNIREAMYIMCMLSPSYSGNES